MHQDGLQELMVPLKASEVSMDFQISEYETDPRERERERERERDKRKMWRTAIKEDRHKQTRLSNKDTLSSELLNPDQRVEVWLISFVQLASAGRCCNYDIWIQNDLSHKAIQKQLCLVQ